MMAPSVEVPLLQHAYPAHNLAGIQSKQPTVNVTSLPTTPIIPTNQAASYNTIVLNPAFITQDFDLLRFEAAAYEQLPKTNADVILTANKDLHDQTSTSPAFSTQLISSPYNNPGHFLDLTTLPAPSLLFAKALTALKPATPEYATAPYAEALNFPTVIDVLRDLVAREGVEWPETSFYVVVFRSKLKDNIDNDYLYKLDFESHREACESGGLLKYWFGKTDALNRNLATCFWHSRADAYAGGLGPWHKKARAAGRELYEHIVFSTWRFVVEEGVKGWRIEEWVD